MRDRGLRSGGRRFRRGAGTTTRRRRSRASAFLVDLHGAVPQRPHTRSSAASCRASRSQPWRQPSRSATPMKGRSLCCQLPRLVLLARRRRGWRLPQRQRRCGPPTMTRSRGRALRSRNRVQHLAVGAHPVAHALWSAVPRGPHARWRCEQSVPILPDPTIATLVVLTGSPSSKRLPTLRPTGRFRHGCVSPAVLGPSGPAHRRE